MTTRTVMAARVGPASRRSVPHSGGTDSDTRVDTSSAFRNVYVCTPVPRNSDMTVTEHQEIIDAVLRGIIRYNDRVLYTSTNTPDARASAGSVVTFAIRHELFADPLPSQLTKDLLGLVIVIIDPLGDNSLAEPAVELARQYNADLILSELPVVLH